MIQIIYPKDPSTEFLSRIYENLNENFGPKVINIHFVEASEEGYKNSFNFIKNLPVKTHLLFIGHGHTDKLYGGESIDFEKKSFVKKSEFNVFKDKYLFSLSCNSNELLRTSLGNSGIINSIGFGILPTEMQEIENIRKLKEINEQVIIKFKDILVELVTKAYKHFLQNNLSFGELSNYLRLLINKKISETILNDKRNEENRILSDLLFQMKSEMYYF